MGKLPLKISVAYTVSIISFIFIRKEYKYNIICILIEDSLFKKKNNLILFHQYPNSPAWVSVDHVLSF